MASHPPVEPADISDRRCARKNRASIGGSRQSHLSPEGFVNMDQLWGAAVADFEALYFKELDLRHSGAVKAIAADAGLSDRHCRALIKRYVRG